MDFYFMPRVPGLEGRVTLANFPPTDGFVAAPGPQIAHVVWSDGAVWQFRAVGTVPAGHCATFTESGLHTDVPADASPFFCLSRDELPRTATSLPRTRHMDTTPNWRSNIQLSGPTTAASYQGEYPKAMLGIDRGTLLSLGPLHQGGENVSTKLILPNMRDNPIIEVAEVRFFGMRSQTLWGVAEVLRNRVSVVSLDAYPADPSDPLCIVSSEISGIPLFLTHTTDFSEMSFEHTHPPAEMVIFGQRIGYQRAMKSWWIERIGR